MILALSLLNLPFADQVQAPTTQGERTSSFEITAHSNCILYHRQMQINHDVSSTMSVSQNYWDPQDPTEMISESEGDEPEPNDKYIIDLKFLPRKVYGCRVVLTNLTSNPLKVAVLKQIPEGTIPVYKNSM